MPGSIDGFGLFDLETVLEPVKQLRNVSGEFEHELFPDTRIAGYEIHCGRTSAINDAVYETLLRYGDSGEPRKDGVVSDDGQIIGTYLHGLFDTPESATALLRWAGLNSDHIVDLATIREQQLDRLADMLQAHILPEFLDELLNKHQAE